MRKVVPLEHGQRRGEIPALDRQRECVQGGAHTTLHTSSSHPRGSVRGGGHGGVHEEEVETRWRAGGGGRSGGRRGAQEDVVCQAPAAVRLIITEKELKRTHMPTGMDKYYIAHVLTAWHLSADKPPFMPRNPHIQHRVHIISIHVHAWQPQSSHQHATAYLPATCARSEPLATRSS